MKHQGEGLKIVRLLMVLSSLSPLFILMGIRGNSLIPDQYFFAFCVVLVFVPSLVLWKRLRTAQESGEVRILDLGEVEDSRSHVFFYLFATLMPIYRVDIETCRDLVAMVFVLVLIVYLFWRLNLHYINVFFELRGYRVFTVSQPEYSNPLSGGLGKFILITKRKRILKGEKVTVFRLSDSVFVEK